MSHNWNSNKYKNEISGANVQHYYETAKQIQENNQDGFSFPQELVQQRILDQKDLDVIGVLVSTWC